jgi:transcriptional regulator with XRE-family HTH domain
MQARHGLRQVDEGASRADAALKPVETTDEAEREVLRCLTCGLVQYRTCTGNCRRCQRALPMAGKAQLPSIGPQNVPDIVPHAKNGHHHGEWSNGKALETVGKRIGRLRECRGMTQVQLEASSRVSRSYLSRLEAGRMTPSLGTLEKISGALEIGLRRFFVPDSEGEALLGDEFIRDLHPYLGRLDWAQWGRIMECLMMLGSVAGHHPTMKRVRR